MAGYSRIYIYVNSVKTEAFFIRTIVELNETLNFIGCYCTYVCVRVFICGMHVCLTCQP